MAGRKRPDAVRLADLGPTLGEGGRGDAKNGVVVRRRETPSALCSRPRSLAPAAESLYTTHWPSFDHPDGFPLMTRAEAELAVSLSQPTGPVNPGVGRWQTGRWWKPGRWPTAGFSGPVQP